MRKIFLLGAAVWLLINVLTLTGYPAVWVDEILSADAGIHLAQGKGFVSAAWFNQPSWEFWASYTPLYAFVLTAWLNLFGLSAFVVRAFGFSLVAASLLMLGLFLKRLGDGSARWITIVALAVCEPLAFLERAGRPDSVSVFLACATALVFVSRDWRWRIPALFLLGLLAVPAALQYTAYVMLLGALLQLWFRPFTPREVAAWGAGAAAGALLLMVTYASHHVLRTFLESTVASIHSSAGRILQQLVLKRGTAPFVFSDIALAPLRDWATPVLILSAAIVWWLATDPPTRKLSSFALACAIVIPLAIQVLGKYPIYYTYMDAIPATIALIAACDSRPARCVILSLLFIGGVGQFWWKGWTQGSEALAESSLRQISSVDTVVADYPAYYQLLGHTKELFAVGYAGGKVMPHFPPSQAERVTKLLVRDSLYHELVQKVGGEWQRIGDVLIERHGLPSRWVTIDDDTRHSYREPVGIYVRTGNRNLSAPAAR